ncbi:MAG: NAD-dependent deacylase [Bacteroidales bacterium]|nr:NAD-dependent deacylase [Bacteroidales bacterium]
MRKKLVVLSGAGMSAESGIKTFRDMGGLWEEYNVMEVASPEAWQNNPELVLRFYNERRKKLFEAKPNEGHLKIAQLEEYFDVQIITQNVDDLHERAGSSNVLHLHGELKKVRSTYDSNLIYTMNTWELKLGDVCEKGFQLRPHIVWFGEDVPAINQAIKICRKADVFLVVGTSLNVYPAAGLIDFVSDKVPLFLIDPNDVKTNNDVTFIKEKASVGMREFKDILFKKYI